MKFKRCCWFFENFDFLIRFFYCRLGPISSLFHNLMFGKLYKSDFKELDRKFENVLELIKKQNISIKNKTILELGPGNSKINAYNFLLYGAKKVYLVDKFPRSGRPEKQKLFSLEEISFIKKKFPSKKLFFLNKNKEINTDFIKFISKDLTKIDNLKVDFIFSISVLEHIKNIEDNIKKMAKILNRGGTMFHHIDLRDHYDFANPFLFYKYSDFIWNNFLTKEGTSYTNRWREEDFSRVFRRNNLKAIWTKRTKYKIGKIAINKKFKDYKKLEIGILDIFLQK